MLGDTKVSIYTKLAKASNFCFSNDPANELQYTFIDEFCGDETELSVYETLVFSDNGVAQMAAFSLEAFTFNGGTGELYMHCNARVCDSLYENCIPNCNNARRRRSLGGKGEPISLGPVQINIRQQLLQYRVMQKTELH